MRGSESRQRNHGLFIAYLALLAWLPVPLGSNRPWAWSLMQAAALLLLAVWLAGWLRRPYALPPAVAAARLPLALLGLWLGYLCLQVVPLPGGVLGASSGPALEIRSHAPGFADAAARALSLDRGATAAEALKALSYVVLLFLTLVLLDGRERVKRLMLVLFFVGFVEAVFGMLAYFAAADLGIGELASGRHPGVRGTYGNRNHFAGLMELTIPLGIGIILYRMDRPGHRESWRARLRELVQSVMDRRARMHLFVVIMCAALFLSTSRGGTAALFVALAATIALAARARGVRARELRFAPALLALGLLAGLWFGVEGLNEKLQHMVSSGFDIDRIPVWRVTAAMIADAPLAGAGAGSFQWLFPAYRGAATGFLYYDHAHNDYLELLAGQGLVGFALLGGAVVLLLARAAGAYLRRRDPLARAALFASLTGVIALLIHALVDFNHQIPANAAYFFVLLGAGIAAGVIERESHRGGPRARALPGVRLRSGAIPIPARPRRA